MAEAPRSNLARVHSLSGIIPLLAFVAIHTWETSAAARGRDAFVARAFGADVGSIGWALELVLVIVPLVAHVGTGVLRARRSTDAGSYPSAGSRRLQWLSGGVLLVFLVLHLFHAHAVTPGATALTSYEVLRQSLSRGVWIAIYVIGLGALSLHVTQGIVAAVRHWGLVRRAVSLRWVRVGAAVFGASVFLVQLNGLAHFARGAAFVRPTPDVAEDDAAPDAPSRRSPAPQAPAGQEPSR